MFVTERAYRALLTEHPDLCAAGLADPELCRQLGLDFAGERRRLEEAYDAFALCCDWLLDCTPLKHVSCMAPGSAALAGHIERRHGTAVGNGAMVAAVLFLRLPHQRLDGSAELRVGISQRSPALAEAAAAGGR